MNEGSDVYVPETGSERSDWVRLKALLVEQEHLRTGRDFVLMAWGLVLAFGAALAGAAEPLGLANYLPRELPLWIMSAVGAASFLAIVGLLLQYRVLRERAADAALRREIEERLERLSHKLGE